MKSPLLIMQAAILVSSALFHPSFAQDETKLVIVNRAEYPTSVPAMENADAIRITNMKSLNVTNLTLIEKVNEKVLHSFTASFKRTSQVAWYIYDKKNKYFLVHFRNDGREYKALYHKSGSLEYAVSIVSANNLSQQITKAIKYVYAGYVVTGAMEIITGSGTTWSINLQKGNVVVVVKAADNEIEELVQYTVPPKVNKSAVAKKN